MWLCETKPQESVVKIGQTLKRRLGIDDKMVNTWIMHISSYLVNDFESLLNNNFVGSSWI